MIRSSRHFRALALVLASAALLAPVPVEAAAGEAEDTASARALFERNLDAIRSRDRAAYLACYLDAPNLVRTGDEGPQLGFDQLARGAGDRWPDTFEATDLRLVSVREGVVYGTYRYRVRYGVEEQVGLSERLFVRSDGQWRIAMTSAFPAPPGTPPPPRALKGATLVDGTGAPPVPNAVVLLRNGRIECAGAGCEIPDGVAVTDVSGMWITPGIVDAHVHFSQTGWADGRPDSIDVRDRYPYDRTEADLAAHPERFFRSDLCSGVTSVFDVGGYPWTVSMAKAHRADPRAPRVAAAGPLLSTVDHWLNLPAEKQLLYVKDTDAARQDVRDLAARGADAVKVWYIVDAEHPVEGSAPMVLAAGEEAKKAGLPLIVHATGLAEAKMALKAGARLLVHGVSDRPLDEEFLLLAKQNGAIYCPTLTVFGGYLRMDEAAADQKAPAVDDPNGCVDPGTLGKVAQSATLTAVSPDRLARMKTRVEEGDRIGRANLKRAAEAGIPIAMGTDAGNPLTLHGPSVYAEMEAMQAAGMTPMQVLVASTRGGALAMGVGKQTGTLEKGKDADLLVVEADPTADVAGLRRLRYVVRGGVLRSIEELHALATAVSPQLQGDLAYGRWPVGFRAIFSKSDASRRLSGGRPRPVPIALWFPSQPPGAAPPMTYGEYLALGSLEYAGNESPTPKERQTAVASQIASEPFDKLAAADVNRWFSTPMLARENPAPAPGPFPLVLIGQGNGETIPDQSFLAEYLASHGYVVASVPSPTLLSGEMKGLKEVAPRTEDQARDLAFALAALEGLPNVARGRVGLVGHSFGARAALLLSMTDARITALVCLDGALGGAANRALLPSRLFDANKPTLPILVFYETAGETPDFGLFRSLSHTDRWFVHVSDIQHEHFSTFGAALPLAPSLAAATGAKESTRAAHDAVCRTTLSFLDAILKDGKPAAAWDAPDSEHWTVEKLARR